MPFLKGKRVLVTGSDGFIGSNLIKRLLHERAQVVTFSTQRRLRPNLLQLEGLTDEIFERCQGSVEDFSKLNRFFQKIKPEIVFHLAGQPIVEVGQESPINTFEVNIKGSWNVLEACRQVGVNKVILLSTAHIYGDNNKLPYKEEYFPQPSRPYETSKACADLLAQSFADTYGLPVEIPRLANVYGPGDFNFTRIVPKVIRQVLSGEAITIWDRGAIRDFLYIDDAVNGLLLLAEKELGKVKRNRVFNFGSGKPIAITDLVLLIAEILGLSKSKINIEGVPADRAKEILKQYVSINKAKQILGWTPRVNLKQGLEETANWYQRYSDYLQ